MKQHGVAGAVADGDIAVQAVADWLTLLAERHDLSLAPPAGEHAAAIAPLLDVFSSEFSDYREVVAGAREAARRNAEHLAEVVRSATQTGAFVHATADAASQAGAGAAQMAAAADALCGFTSTAAGAARDAVDSLAAITLALGEVTSGFGQGTSVLAQMRKSTDGVAGFLVTLGRLSRHAQLLGVNASIEAAHLAEQGSRFGIVAEEVRKLSVSTRDSKTGVTRIVAELRASTQEVVLATGESQESTATARDEIGGAGEALALTASGIVEFEQLVTTLADVAATQIMALEAIGASIADVAHHADGAATASRDAAGLDIDGLLARAQTNANRWTPRAQTGSRPHTESPLGRWIAAIASGDDPAPAPDIAERDELRPIVAAVRGLLARVDAEQRTILADVVAAAVAVSHNSYAWLGIATSLTGLQGEIAIVHETAVESAGAARNSAEVAAQMQTLVETMRSRYTSALPLLDGALARIAGIGGSVHEIDGFVASMSGAAKRADDIMALIETLSSETDLLSLNAAIEAAHAGELGQGFSVIAEEIRVLARSTNDSTLNVSELVSSISTLSAELQGSVGAAAASMSGVVGSASGVHAALATLQASFTSSMECAHDIFATATEQTRGLDRVLDTISRSSSAVEHNTTTNEGRLALASLGSRAHAIAARRPIGTVTARVRELGELLSTRLEAALEAALADQRLSLDALLTLTYAPITGTAIAGLGRLFDVSRVPAAGFSPAKYATPWDAFIDEAFIGVLTQGWDEAEAAALSPVTMVVSDLNGLFYAYPRRKIAPWTNDPLADAEGNRIKRLFEDDDTLRVARHGLGSAAAELGARSSYAAFRAAGCDLARPAVRPWGAFVYARDTSSVCNEVALAIYARGTRHSTLRLCYDAKLV